MLEEGRVEVWAQVAGHIEMAKTTGATDFALECLKDKKDVRAPDVYAGYVSAQMKKTDLQKREGDNPDDDLTPDGDKDLSEEQKTTALVDKAMGLSNKPAQVEA